MLNKIGLFALFFSLFISSAFSQEESIEVLVKKEGTPNFMSVIELNGYRQALTKALVDKSLDSELFWQKIEEKKMTDVEERDFLKPLFINPVLLTGKPGPEELYLKSVFKYTLDQAKFNGLISEYLSNLPDVSLKTFYILPEISIDKDMLWSDVGVTKKENFVDVIVESWKKWAATQFKGFANIVVLEKDFVTIPENLNSESVTLKWTSQIKKSEVFQDRKSARFEMTAQYVIVGTKSKRVLLGFDFPTQKREVGISVPKDLSSNLASLVYNLLNSQTTKINGALETPRLGGLTAVEIKVVGKHGLLDITQINSFLTERFKDVGLTSELKSYSSESSVISIKSNVTSESLYALFAKEGGKLPLNEQKILLFSPIEHTFAIIPKEANN